MFMKENDKVYGFTLALYESEKTIPTLWDVTKGERASVQPSSIVIARIEPYPEFIKKHPQYLAEDNAMGFLSDNYGKSYNLCHCECDIQNG